MLQLAIGGQHASLLAVPSDDAPPPPADPAAAAAAEAEESDSGDEDDVMEDGDVDGAAGGVGEPPLPDPWAAAAGACTLGREHSTADISMRTFAIADEMHNEKRCFDT